MKVAKSLALYSSILLAIPAVSMASSYSLLPGVNYVNAGNSRAVTTSFSVVNKDTTPLVLAIDPIYQAAGTSNPGPFQNDKALADQGQFSLLPYIRISPAKLNIKPGDARSIRISVRLPANLPAGTYRAGIDFAQQSAPSSNANNVKLEPNQLSAEVVPLIDQIAALYINVGNGNAQNAQVSCHTVAAGDIQISANNNTNWIFNPDVSVYSATANTSSSKALTNVIPIPLMAQTSGMREVKWNTTDKGPYKITWRLRETKNAVTSTVFCQ
ncbi:MAG: hypothetical protein K0Q57_351 [Gammaproteobacteria bacterium]|jgi:hypothetical protein|nr:hypothetical protein [Gammaproteobacteria bacterium]